MIQLPVGGIPYDDLVRKPVDQVDFAFWYCTWWLVCRRSIHADFRNIGLVSNLLLGLNLAHLSE